MRSRVASSAVIAALLLTGPARAQELVPAAGAQTAVRVLPVGAEIPLSLAERLDTSTARKGDLVRFTVAETVLLQGEPVIPAGAIAVGQVSQAEQSSLFGVAGRLAVELLWLEQGSRKLRIRGSIVSKGNARAGESAALSAATGFGLFIKGGQAELPPGTPAQAVLLRELRLEP